MGCDLLDAKPATAKLISKVSKRTTFVHADVLARGSVPSNPAFDPKSKKPYYYRKFMIPKNLHISLYMFPKILKGPAIQVKVVPTKS